GPTDFRAGPYLIRSKPGEMLVVMKANFKEPPVVHWWVAPDREHLDPPGPDSQTAVRSRRRGEFWVAELTRLPMDTVIGYQVHSDYGATEPSSFKAGVSRGRPFRFAAFGDTRTNHDVHQAVIDAVAK